MMRLFCLVCGKEGSLENDDLCCGRSTENVDPEILDSLIILNKKGWQTEWSCAGHEGEDFNGMAGPWISFHWTENTPPVEAPLGFVWRPYPCAATHSSSWPTLARNPGWNSIPLEDSREVLLEWCKELPHKY